MTYNEVIKEVVSIIDGVQSVKKHYIIDKKLHLELKDELVLYSVEIMDLHIKLFAESHAVIEPKVNIHRDYNSVYINLKK